MIRPAIKEYKWTRAAAPLTSLLSHHRPSLPLVFGHRSIFSPTSEFCHIRFQAALVLKLTIYFLVEHKNNVCNCFSSCAYCANACKCIDNSMLVGGLLTGQNCLLNHFANCLVFIHNIILPNVLPRNIALYSLWKAYNLPKMLKKMGAIFPFFFTIWTFDNFHSAHWKMNKIVSGWMQHRIKQSS